MICMEMSLMKYNTTVLKMDGCIVRVHKPILTATERKAREEEVKEALVNYIKETRNIK